MEYGLKLPPEDDYEVRYGALQADIDTDEPTTVTSVTPASTEQDQNIKENTGK